MASEKYTYSVQNDFLNSVVDTDGITKEIQASSITIALDFIGVSGDVCDIWFKASLSAGEIVTLSGLVSAHTGEPPAGLNTQTVTLYGTNNLPLPISDDGRLRTISEKSSQPRETYYTHDWTDPTTWYQTSERVVDEIATDSGDHLTYILVNQNVIDTYHGLIFNEDYLLDNLGNSYRVVVKVNAVTKVERDPHYVSPQGGEHYSVNYALGTITFLSALDPGDVVRVTYHKSVNSQFDVIPPADTQMFVDLAEVQFAADVDLTDTMTYTVMGLADVFAPTLLTTANPPGPLPPGTLIPLKPELRYKTMTDFQADAVRSYVEYPVMGGNSWRGAAQPIRFLDWDYVSSDKPLVATAGMLVRLRLQHDTPYGGWYASATFYCRTEAC